MRDILLVKSDIDYACKVASLIPVESAIALMSEFEQMDSLMPVLDPTGWMEISDNIKGHKLAAKAFLEFRQKLETLKEVTDVSIASE